MLHQKGFDKLNDNTLASAVKKYGLNPKDFTYIGGNVNVVYEHTEGAIPCILRLTPRTWRSIQDVTAETMWVRALADQGAPVSDVIPSARSATPAQGVA